MALDGIGGSPGAQSRYAVLQGLAARLAQARSLAETFEAAVDVILDAGSTDRAALLIFDDHSVMRFRAWRGLSDDYRRAVDGHSPWRPEDADATPIYCDDVADDEDLTEYLHVFEGEGIQALAFLPLVAGRFVIGKFMLYSAAKRNWAEGDLELLHTATMMVAGAIASALARQRLENEVAVTRALERHTPVGMLFEVDGGTIERANRAFCEMFGLGPPETLHGRSCADVAAEIGPLIADVPGLVARQMATMSEATPRHGNMIELTDGRFLEQSYRPVESPDETRRHLWTYVDVTARRDMERRLFEADKMKSLGSLAGVLAHDFNNALTSILGYAHLLDGELDDRPDLKAQVRELLRVGGRATELTRSLLTFARGRPVETRTINLRNELRESVELFQRAAGSGVSFSMETPREGIFVDVDPTQLHQTITNLVLNARDAMPEGGDLTIRLTAEAGKKREPPVASVAVIDSGVGMDAETRARIFEPFFTTKRAAAGAGLGLASCYGMAAGMGGEIRVSSAPGKGSTFELRIPIVAEASTVEPEIQEGVARTSATVLVADDDEDVLEVVSALLQRAGYVVICARDGEEAWSAWSENRDAIDLVLTDVRMPGMGGIELVEKLWGESPGTAVILMSGFVDDPPPRGVELILKPFEPDDLLVLVRRALARSSGSAVRAATGD